MRLVVTACLATAIACFASVAQAAISVQLTIIGGSAVVGAAGCEGDMECVAACPGDTLELQIETFTEKGDGLTLSDPAISFDPTAGALNAEMSSEEPFQVVNGVVMAPIGAPGSDLGEISSVEPGETVPGSAGGWEMATLTPGGAPGPATILLGTALFDLTGVGTVLEMDAMFGGLWTVMGDGDFNDISEAVTYNAITIVPDDVKICPEPGSTLAAFSAFGTLAVIARRKRAA